MPFAPNPVTTEQLVKYLTTNAGTEVGCQNIREAANQLNVSYATACKRLKSYKSGVGKWNLTVQEIEQAYEAPSACADSSSWFVCGAIDNHTCGNCFSALLG